MKKIIPLVLIMALLAGCKITNYTPELVDFNQNSSYTSGDFSCNCNVTLQDNVVTVTATSSNAEGLMISYNGNEITYKYGEMVYSLPNANQSFNPAVAVYEAFLNLKSSESVNASKTDDGFEYKGQTSYGSFILLQYDNNSYKSLNFPDANIKFEFY